MMLHVTVFLILLILFTLIVQKTEKFIPYGGAVADVKARITQLKKSNKRYSSKEDVLNDILRILNCGGEYNFTVVNIQITSGNSIFTTLFDKTNAFVSNIEFSVITKTENDKDTGNQFYYYNIDQIKISQAEMDKNDKFYNPEPEIKYAAPW